MLLIVRWLDFIIPDVGAVDLKRERVSLLIIVGALLVLFWLALGRGSELRSLQVAAEKGDTHAQVQLGKIYADGRVVPRNRLLALKWFVKASETGDAEAQFRVAEIFEIGLGVKSDYRASIDFFYRAARQHYAPAESALGMAYQLGEGVDRDLIESYKWLQLGLDHGDTNAAQMISDVSVVMDANDIAEAKRRAAAMESGAKK
jgi:TPR repeat protein